MFAVDTQLFNKNDESVKKSFDILTIYEKPLVQKSIMKRKKVCILNRLKTLGIHHGYNIQNNEIWKSIIDKMKNCVHVWKSRNLAYTEQTLIVKNLLISLCGYEIEMRGIPEKYVKEITTLVWGFIWGGGIYQIDRKVCCLGVENGGMGMINIQEFIDSKRIKLLYRFYMNH
jgi:hypothetical protein